MSILSFFVFLLAGLYLDKVLPSQFGIRQPPHFFLLPSYWLASKKRTSDACPPFEENTYLPEGNYEDVSGEIKKQEGEKQVMKVHGLKKQFGSFQAVKDVNLKMYKNQIFALLGHNGAGKTTTLSMLTGLIETSAGSAEVYGTDLFNDMDKVRNMMGVCPQHDVLFDNLTPVEHLSVFCDFKGFKDNKQQEIEKVLKDVDLWHLKGTIAKNLSGGSKRKLSLAIALVGGSKFVLLDEPTSGMDLTARRQMWEMLKSYKQNRIIILTTHYMDEADILGDRIGIMTEGKIFCLGSSLFLKNRFGVGYNLTMVKSEKEPNTLIEPFLVEKLG
jgi:ATP-binding cassette subfamily A (ABC1) protein 3